MQEFCNKYRENKIKCLLICVLLSLILCACGSDDSDKVIVLTTGFQNNELFRIDSDSCYANEAYVYLVNTENQYNSLYGKKFLSESINGVYTKTTVAESVLSKLTRVKIMNLMAANFHVVLDDSDLEIINKAANEYYNGLSGREKQLFDVNSAKDVEELYKNYRIAQKVYEYIVKDIDPEISDDEARTMIVKEIFFETKNLTEEEKQDKLASAEDVISRIEEGEDFENLAVLYSDKEQIHNSYTKMSIDERIKDKAFNLSKGDTSDILEGSDGYYIIYCEDPFSRDETDTTKAQIVEDRKLKAFESAYDKYATDRKYYFNEEAWSQITGADISDTETSNFFEIYYSYFE